MSVHRIGAVSYLNTRPLVHGLDARSDVALTLDLPSRLACRLVAGEYDVALVPVATLFEHPDLEIVAGGCIACRGPVRSVKLCCRVDPRELRSLALDEGSRTSAILARLVLAERYGVRPQCRPLPIEADWRRADADGVLVIGDRAIERSGEFPVEFDLGAVWWEWTGLPFVFAVWAARPGGAGEALRRLLGEARDAGSAAIDEIARREGPRHGLTEEECRIYLGRHLHFQLGPEEWRGFEEFHRRAAALGLAVAEWEPRIDERLLVGSDR